MNVSSFVAATNNHDRNNSNNVVMMFKTSLVNYVGSKEVRLPGNFIGVRCVRPDISTKPKKDNNNNGTGNRVNVKFIVIDDNGNERKMTKAEKKAKKRELKNDRNEEYQQVKRQKLNVEDISVQSATALLPKTTSKLSSIEANERMQETEEEEETTTTLTSSSISNYHQLPVNLNTLEEEIADAKEEQAGLPTIMLSPPMAEQLLPARTKIRKQTKDDTSVVVRTNDGIIDDTTIDNNCIGETAVLMYSASLSQQWSNQLQERCIVPAETMRQREDLRPLAYRLNPEPWQRMRLPITRDEEKPLFTSSRNHSRRPNNITTDNNNSNNNSNNNNNTVTATRGDDRKKMSTTTTKVPVPSTIVDSLSSSSIAAAIISSNEVTINNNDGACIFPKPCDWISMTCRPRLSSITPPTAHTTCTRTNTLLQHDDIISIVFEYLHRETNFYVSCGAKFGADFLIYDGPREERHAFAGLRILSPPLSQSSALPLPSAYSLTSFVRCLNTAGKLALLATVEEIQHSKEEDDDDDDDGVVVLDDDVHKQEEGGKDCNKKIATTQYQVAFVDVALEKVLDVHKQKKKSSKKKLQKRRDVTKNLAKN